MGSLKDDLAAGIERVETHISWVFLGPSTVWKVKKPVQLGFLDFSTLEQRRRACDAEVRLNSRLAPNVYRSVVPVTRGPDGRHRIGGEGPPVDFAVEMARLPDARRADVMLREGRLTGEHVDILAGRLARFHADMATDECIGSFGTPEAILRNVQENFAQTRTTVGEHLSAAEALEIETKQARFIDEHRDLLVGRVWRGGGGEG
jgi:uncharacterized protein